MKTVLVSAMLLVWTATASWAAVTCMPIVNNAPVVDGIVAGGDIGRPDTVKIPASCPSTTADIGWGGASGRGIDRVAGPAGAKTPTLFFAAHQSDGKVDKIYLAVHVEKAPDFTTNDQLTIYFQADASKGDWDAKDFALVFGALGPDAATPGNDGCTSPKDPRYFTRAPDNARWVAQATVPAGIAYKASYDYDQVNDPQFPLWELEISIDVSNAGMNLNIVKGGQIGLGAKLYLFEAGIRATTAYHYPGPITDQKDLTPIPDSGIDLLPNQGGVTPATLDKVAVGGCAFDVVITSIQAFDADGNPGRFTAPDPNSPADFDQTTGNALRQNQFMATITFVNPANPNDTSPVAVANSGKVTFSVGGIVLIEGVVPVIPPGPPPPPTPVHFNGTMDIKPASFNQLGQSIPITIKWPTNVRQWISGSHSFGTPIGVSEAHWEAVLSGFNVDQPGNNGMTQPLAH
jgi:hypothetical protein